jgi:hypothetical protein
MRDDALARTAEEDGTVMILKTKSTPALNTNAPISAEWRRGELW